MIVGGGIAGVSVAYSLVHHPARPTVTLLEAESQLAHHTTGRSAALLTENYGAAPVRALTSAGLSFLREPPADYSDAPVLHRRSLLTVADADQSEAMDRVLDEGRRINPDIEEVSPAEAIAAFPALRSGAVSRALLEPDASDIDVAGLHQTFVRGFRAMGGEVRTSARVDAARRPDGGTAGWIIETTDGEFTADIVVDAAGAWGDVVAARAGVEPVGLQPKRRTAFMVSSPRADSAEWAMTADVDHAWYIKPDGSQFLCSPGDETPSEPLDAKPEQIDVAVAIERINAATTLEIRSVRSSWAGLRTFAPDRSMVIGPDPEHPDFFWLVGQGGTGIQSSPGAGALAADLLLDGTPGSTFDGLELDLARILPGRLRS